MNLNTLFRRFRRNECGVTAVEYSLVATLIAVVIVTAVTSVGSNVQARWTTVASKVQIATGMGSSSSTP